MKRAEEKGFQSEQVLSVNWLQLSAFRMRNKADLRETEWRKDNVRLFCEFTYKELPMQFKRKPSRYICDGTDHKNPKHLFLSVTLNLLHCFCKFPLLIAYHFFLASSSWI
jgi:hypothetical protein